MINRMHILLYSRGECKGFDFSMYSDGDWRTFRNSIYDYKYKVKSDWGLANEGTVKKTNLKMLAKWR